MAVPQTAVLKIEIQSTESKYSWVRTDLYKVLRLIKSLPTMVYLKLYCGCYYENCQKDAACIEHDKFTKQKWAMIDMLYLFRFVLRSKKQLQSKKP